MPGLTSIGAWTSPNTVAIFAQKPGTRFTAFALSLVPIPLADRVRLDLAETEDARRRYSVTRNPVERLVAQNRIREPLQLTVTGMLSANALLSTVLPTALLRLDKKELAKLRDIADKNDLVFVVTPERYYENMMITEIAEHADSTTGHGTALTISFEEAIIVSPGLVRSTLDLDSLGLGTDGTDDLGVQTGTVVPDPGGLG